MSESFRVTDEARTWLLAWARRSVAACLDAASAQPQDAPEIALRCLGCFVTLHKRTGSLRGCIGTFSEDGPLWQNVQEMAIAAATRDPRFPRMRLDELSQCVFEISVLTPRERAQANDVEVGRHGVCIERGDRRGVLLPQVATDNGWDREAFLDYTCAKAGLPTQAWRDGSAAIEIFSAEVFGEDH